MYLYSEKCWYLYMYSPSISASSFHASPYSSPNVVNLIAVLLGTYAILFDDGYRKTVKPNCMKPMPEVCYVTLRYVTPNLKCQTCEVKV